MKWSELLQGDILVRDGNPIFLVLKSVASNNEFVWVSLQSSNAFERIYKPNLSGVGFWDKSLYPQYTSVLRGNAEIMLCTPTVKRAYRFNL